MKMPRIRSLAGVALAASLLAPATGQAAPTRLTATVGPGFTITLTNARGVKVRTVKPGVYRITVRDRSAHHNFHLVGPRVNRATSVTAVRRVVWTVTLRRGVYRYICDPHAIGMRGSFRVR